MTVQYVLPGSTDSLLLGTWHCELTPLQRHTSCPVCLQEQVPLWLQVLTFIANAKADVRVALVRGEEEEQEVGGADEELWNLGALVTANQR